jgi:hypothetical protein
MKTLRILIAIIALLVALKDGKALVFPGENVLIFQNVQEGEQTVRMGVVYNLEGQAIMKIPADTIIGVGSINYEKPKLKVELR